MGVRSETVLWGRFPTAPPSANAGRPQATVRACEPITSARSSWRVEGGDVLRSRYARLEKVTPSREAENRSRARLRRGRARSPARPGGPVGRESPARPGDRSRGSPARPGGRSGVGLGRGREAGRARGRGRGGEAGRARGRGRGGEASRAWVSGAAERL